MRNNEAMNNFLRCAEQAPAGTYEQAKELADLLSCTCDDFMRAVRAMGLRASNHDPSYVLQSALYDYVKQSNPDSGLFPTAEGFGSAMSSVARERVLAQSVLDVSFLRTIGAI